MSFRSCYLVFLLGGAAACRQDVSTPVVQIDLSFAAIITADIDRSSAWYISVFGLDVTRDVSDASSRVIILTSEAFTLELLQLSGSVNRSQALDTHPAGTQIQGHFKIGFEVENLDSWIAHLESRQVDVPQVFTDAGTGKRNFLVQDPDGNLIQFFE